MFPPKSPLEQLLYRNNDGIVIYGDKGMRMSIAKQVGSRFIIEANSKQILVSGEQLFDAIVSVFKSLEPINEQPQSK